MMKLLKCFKIEIFFIFLSLSFSCHAKEVEIGIKEKIILFPLDISQTAKIDTGAATSSINVASYKIYKIKHQTRIRYQLCFSNTSCINQDQPLWRWIKIKNRASEMTTNNTSSNKRPVIKLKLQIDKETHSIAVNLVNRKHFNDPILIGEEALKKFKIKINPNIQNTTRFTLYLND